MKAVLILLLIIYATTISGHEHSELCGGLESGVNPCRECNSGNIALFGSDPQYKSSPGFGLPLANNGLPGYKKVILTPSRINNKQVVCSGPGCGGIGIIRDAPERNLGGIGIGGIGTGGISSMDPNAKAAKMFQPITDLCSHRGRGSIKSNNLLHKGKKMIVRPARPGRIPCKIDKPNSSTFGPGLLGYNSKNYQIFENQQKNQKFATAFKNVMNKVTHKNIFNGDLMKGINKYPIFNGDNTGFGNMINQVNSNNLIPSGSTSSKNVFSQGSNIFNTNTLNTMTTSSNSASNDFFSGLTKLLSNGQSNNYATNQGNTVKTGLKAELLVPVAYTTNNHNGQLNNDQLSNGQLISGQSSNNQFSNVQSSSSQFSNVQSSNNQFGNVQLTNGQFNNGQSKNIQSKPPAIVNFIDPSSGNIRAMTREEFCDDKKLSYEDQEKIYKGEHPSQGGGPIDAVSWQIYINELLGSLMHSKTFQSTKTVPEGILSYGHEKSPVNEPKRPTGMDVPEEILHTVDKPPVEFKNPLPQNTGPKLLLNWPDLSFFPHQPPNNGFVPQSPSPIAEVVRTAPDDVPCGNIGPALPDYRPGAIVPVDGTYDGGDSSEYNEGTYQINQQSYGQSFVNSDYSHGDQIHGGYSDSNHQHTVTCTCV